jgi:SAM-dependent methyltransferase
MYFESKILSLDTSPYSPHTIAPRLVKSGSVVLDVGCNAGYLGRYLKEEKNCVCDGIDLDPVALKKAKPYYRNLYQIDLFKDDFSLGFTYDFILFVDILEHLPNPERTLKKLVRNLKPKGKAIICLPNIARFELRLKHLLGNFDYRPGVMNDDHLRFFTLRTGRELIESSGLRVDQVLPTGLGARIKILPTLTAFQFIYVARKR